MNLIKEKKIRRHKISDGNPAAAMLISLMAGYVLLLFAGSIFEKTGTAVFGLPENSGYPAAAAGFVILLLYRLWYRPEFEGALRGGHPEYALKLGLPILIVWGTVPFMFMLTPAGFGWPTAITVGTSLAAGVCEEAVFRSFPLSTFMRRCRNERMIPVALIITSVIFGATHGLNVLVGADKGSTASQVITATMLGMFFGALYLRCANLWPGIILHALNDIIALTNVSHVSEQGVVTGAASWWDYVDLVTCTVLAAISLWLIRPEKRAEIREIWKHKWTLPDETPATEVREAPVAEADEAEE